MVNPQCSKNKSRKMLYIGCYVHQQTMIRELYIWSTEKDNILEKKMALHSAKNRGGDNQDSLPMMSHSLIACDVGGLKQII
jgi:hypothetical protein